MRQRLPTGGTMKNQFNRFFKGHPFASRSAARVEIMILLIFQSDVEFFEHPTFLAQNEAFELVGLQSPMENKPTRLRVTGSPQAHQRMVIKVIEYLTNRVKSN